VHAFDVLGDPVRRRILELLAGEELTAGAVCAVIQEEFRISQPAVSQHLRVLREAGLATVRPAGTRRLYAVNPEPMRDVDAWLDRFRGFWAPPLLALENLPGADIRRGTGPGTPTQTGRAIHDQRQSADQRRPAAGRGRC
jgi:DNA-binding transcriptional ArsR family regulator